MSETSPHSESAQQRHWLYGLNAMVLVVIGAVVLGFVFYFGNGTRGSAWASFDWTSSGANSLSGSTQKLLKEIADGKQTYKMFSMYPSRSDIEKRDNRNVEQDEHRQQVLDLLNGYARRSNGRITVEDYGDRPSEEVQRQIRDLYATELKPYEDTLGEFDPLEKKLAEFVQDQATKIGIAGQKAGVSAKDAQIAGSIQGEFQALPDDLDELKRQVKKLEGATLPRWGTIRDAVQKGIVEGDVYNMLDMLSDPAKVKAVGLPDALTAYFISANAEYKAMFSEIMAYKDKLSKLQPLKVDDVLESLQRNTVAILGTDSAKVVSDFDIYSMSPGQQGGSAMTTFTGEQAISSALLAISHPDKVKVVFVGLPSGGNSMYNDIKDVLKSQNFDPMDWSPPAATPGGPPPESSAPPAEGKGVVWIVFPPSPDPQMSAMGLPPTADAQPIIDATRRHMADGGQVLFLAEASANNPMMGQTSGGFPYQDLVKDFGIDVESKYTAVTLREGDDPQTGQHITRVVPFIFMDQYPDNEITRPMQSLQTVFAPVNQNAPSFVTVVQVASPLPKEIDAQVIVQTPRTTDTWGETSFSPDAKYDAGTDMPSPLPLAVVATRNKGQKDKDGKSMEQRIAVIGSKEFASDPILESAQDAIMGGQLIQIPQYPGNLELMKNTVLWLAGYENMIAVSAKANQAARIGNVSPVQLAIVRSVVAVGLPLAALLLGGVIWMVRRR